LTDDVKRLCILGSTGSIGSSALDVVRHLPGRFEVVGLSAWRSWRKLAEQCREFRPKFAAVMDEESAGQLKEELGAEAPEILSGAGALEALVESAECDVVLSAVVGSAGLKATFRAAELGRRIALANKETVVAGGPLLRSIAAESGAEIIPVDSEHSAVFQALHSGTHAEVKRLIITGSGGPFRKLGAEELEKVTPEQALAHPTWAMGRKITIDSATLMNKALEVIEARWLFEIEAERIEVLIHPESIVHSLVEYVDGSTVAQLGLPDMRVPIQYALTYPERCAGSFKRLELAEVGKLTFEKPAWERFPALGLGFDVARQGGTSGAALSAANEVAVEAFLAGRIGFPDITHIAGEVLKGHAFVAEPTLEEILITDAAAREAARKLVDVICFR